MFEDVDRLRMNPVEGYDVEKFDHKLFASIANILTNMGTLNFREVSTLIGQSLVSEFAELDDSENVRNVSVVIFDSILCFRMEENLRELSLSQKIKLPSCPSQKGIRNIH